MVYFLYCFLFSTLFSIFRIAICLQIVPKNEFTPVWVSPKFVNNSFPSVVLRETVLPATEVTVFSASDQDRGADGVIQYKIETIKEHFKNSVYYCSLLLYLCGVLGFLKNILSDFNHEGVCRLFLCVFFCCCGYVVVVIIYLFILCVCVLLFLGDVFFNFFVAFFIWGVGGVGVGEGGLSGVLNK